MHSRVRESDFVAARYSMSLRSLCQSSVEGVSTLCDKQRYYLDLAKSRGRIGLIASQQCLYQLSILCK